MATFYNQATLSYNDNVINSNIVTGEIVEVITASKIAVPATYSIGDEITYVISIINSGTSAFTNLTVTDNLGAYTFGAGQVVPLTYVDGSVRYFANGVLQAAPTVVSENPLVFSGISVPANGNSIIVYRARVNSFAPPDVEGVVTNSAVISGDRVTPVTVEATISAASSLGLVITKSVSPEVVPENGQLTYTFTITNTGTVPALVSDNLVVTDTFDPILDITAVSFNGTAWTEPDDYTYDETTGAFATVAGQITVPAATYSQNPATGEWVVTPGVSILRVTGTI